MCVCLDCQDSVHWCFCAEAKTLDVKTPVGELELCASLAHISVQLILPGKPVQCITGPGNARV